MNWDQKLSRNENEKTIEKRRFKIRVTMKTNENEIWTGKRETRMEGENLNQNYSQKIEAVNGNYNK